MWFGLFVFSLILGLFPTPAASVGFWPFPRASTSAAVGGASNVTLWQLISTNPNLTSLTALLQNPALANVTAALNNTGSQPVLLFAPNNAALAAVAPFFASAPSWLLYNTLLYHAVPLLAGGSPPTLQGATPLFLATQLKNASLVYLGPNQGQVVRFQKQPNRSLTLSWGSVTNPRQTAQVVAGPFAASNGGLYVIDQVMSIPPAPMASALLASLQGYVWAAWFSMMNQVVNAAPHATFFAPTNDAWNDFFTSGYGAQGVTPSQVAQIVNFNLIPSAVYYSTNLVTGSYTAADGNALQVTRSGGLITVSGAAPMPGANNSAQVVLADVITRNGVIHGLSKVLVPLNYVFSTNTTSGSSSGTVSGRNFLHSKQKALEYMQQQPQHSSTLGPQAPADGSGSSVLRLVFVLGFFVTIWQLFSMSTSSSSPLSSSSTSAQAIAALAIPGAAIVGLLRRRRRAH